MRLFFPDIAARGASAPQAFQWHAPRCGSSPKDCLPDYHRSPWNASTAVFLLILSVLTLTWLVEPTFCGQGGSKHTKAGLTKADMVKLERRILALTNKERVRRGLQPLKSSKALHFLARGQSANMCSALRSIDRSRSKNKCALPNFEHESDLFPAGWQVFSERLRMVNLKSGAENIACRTLEADLDRWAEVIVQGWMNSDHIAHRKNILNPEHRFLGVGVVPCVERIGYITQVFSSRKGTVPRDRE